MLHRTVSRPGKVSKGYTGWDGGTYQCYAVDIHRMWREACSHSNKVSRDLNWILEGHAWVIVAAADTSIRDAQLPDDVAKPLLVDAQLGGLGLGAVEVGGKCISQLLLQG